MEERLGSEFVETRGIPFEKSFEETGPETPTFFILSPGTLSSESCLCLP